MSALTPILLILLGISVFVTMNPLLGLIIIVIGYLLDWFVFEKRILGPVPEHIVDPVDRERIRAYRERHPDATIGEALSAVVRDESST